MVTKDIFGENYSGFTNNHRSASRGIIVKNGSVLLSHEKAIGQFMIPGGGFEDGETAEQCCIREIAEETGITAEPEECFLVINEYYEDWCYKSYYFTCRETGQCPRAFTEREKEVCAEPEWVPLAEALKEFSRHAEYDGINEERRGIYQREYMALCEYEKLRGR